MIRGHFPPLSYIEEQLEPRIRNYNKKKSQAGKTWDKKEP